MQYAAILAGGQSRRMQGADKALLDLGGIRLVDRVIERLAPQADTLCLIGPQDYGTRLAVVADDPAFAGPLAGIFGMLAWLEGHDRQAEGFLTVPVDAPLCPADLAKRLAGQNASAVAADPNRAQPTFAYWRLTDLRQVRTSIDSDAPMIRLADAVGARRVVWPDIEPFINLNTPQDYQAFLDGRTG